MSLTVASGAAATGGCIIGAGFIAGFGAQLTSSNSARLKATSTTLVFIAIMLPSWIFKVYAVAFS
jgi:hypothetical protein